MQSDLPIRTKLGRFQIRLATGFCAALASSALFWAWALLPAASIVSDNRAELMSLGDGVIGVPLDRGDAAQNAMAVFRDNCRKSRTLFVAETDFTTIGQVGQNPRSGRTHAKVPKLANSFDLSHYYFISAGEQMLPQKGL